MKDNVNELLIERLKEKGLNPEDFKDVLDAIKQPKYGLIWEDHPEHIEERMKYNRPVLREEKELRIDSGYGHTNNILMEGDNLASLIAMREDGKKVDVIYIDPPYNTGNEFVYNDKIVDKEDSFRHSKWLSFMEKRLKVARDLMTDAGVIFVSIDDNEQANLKLLMDEVFGEENDLGTITVVNNMKGRSDSKFFATSSEFMQVYAKQSSQCIINGLPVSEDYIKEFKFKDTIGRYKHVALKKTGKNSLRSDRPNLYYPIYYNPKTNHSSLDKLSDEYIEILPIHSNGTDGRWSWGKDTFLSKKDSELDFKMNSKKQYMPYIKMRLGEGDDIRTVRPKTAWIGPEYSTSNSANMIKEVLLQSKKI